MASFHHDIAIILHILYLLLIGWVELNSNIIRNCYDLEISKFPFLDSVGAYDTSVSNYYDSLILQNLVPCRNISPWNTAFSNRTPTKCMRFNSNAILTSLLLSTHKVYGKDSPYLAELRITQRKTKKKHLRVIPVGWACCACRGACHRQCCRPPRLINGILQ